MDDSLRKTGPSGFLKISIDILFINFKESNCYMPLQYDDKQ